MSDITMIVTTFYPTGAGARWQTLGRALSSWRLLLHEGRRFTLVVDDGSDRVFDLHAQEWRQWALYQANVRVIEPPKAPPYNRGLRGVGASLNIGIKECNTDLILYAVDDWYLSQAFDLAPWARILEDDPSVGCVRFFPHPHLQGGRILNYPQAWAIEFDRAGYYWAQRPALYHRRFFDAYGSFPEGVSALSVDALYNERVCGAFDPAPRVIHALPQAWRHLEDNTVELGDLVPGTPVPAERLR